MRLSCYNLLATFILHFVEALTVFALASVPIDIYYLEVRVWPIRFITMKRRCLYLHRILQQRRLNAVQVVSSTTQGPKTR